MGPALAPQIYTNFWVCLFSSAATNGVRAQSGFVVEIGTSTNVGGNFASFSEFQSALASRTPEIAWGAGSTPSLSVVYTNSQNVVLSADYDSNLTSDAQGRVHMFPTVTVNGVVILLKWHPVAHYLQFQGFALRTTWASRHWRSGAARR